MTKNYVTEQQFKTLKEAYEKTVDITNYSPYTCALSFKGKHGNWIHALYAVPQFNKGYFKKVRGNVYIYHEDGNDRYCLSEDCLKLLGIN